MIYNFHRLNNKSMSIATMVISFIFAMLFLILGLKYESNVLVGFILLMLACFSSMTSSIVSFIKCKKFGDENLKISKAPDGVEDKVTFNRLSNLIAIFTIIFVLLFVVGLIVMLA